MNLIQKFIKNRKLNKFRRQEELRLEKERIQVQTDLRIRKMKEELIIKEKQDSCIHDFVEIGKNRRTHIHMFNLRETYYVYDLICKKCHLEKVNKSEEYRNYLLNKTKIINTNNR